mmetsp:Transcript_5278/g.8172  ORF Transcript_5278/g.8172 Transcript_5278/m.8172 type:complete len:81 (+) Transcript_5278:1424-1666(+)
MGISLFSQMFCLTLQSMTTTYLMSSKLGVHGFFYLLAGLNILAVLIFSFFLKETKGLSADEKRTLYYPKVENEEEAPLQQ